MSRRSRWTKSVRLGIRRVFKCFDSPGWTESALWLGGAVAIAAVAGFFPLLGFMPPSSEGRQAAGVLVTAQATVAALGVAVMVFVLQGLRSVEIDSAIVREEYERRIGAAARLFSLLALAALSVVLYLLMQPSIEPPSVRWTVNVGNFVVPVALNLAVTLIVTWRFFSEAQRLSRRSEIREVERAVVDRIVRDGVNGFVRRLKIAQESSLSSLSVLFGSDPAEGVVDEALQVHFDALRRAMTESRLTDYRNGFEGLRQYVESARDEFQREGIGFGPPGARPWWQPLSGIHDKILWLKEDVLRRTAWSPYTYELTRFDYWLANRGLRWRCGELYGVGVSGWRTSYEIAARLDDPELRRLIIERTWRLLADAVVYLIHREDDEGENRRPIEEQLDPSNSADLEYLYFLVTELERQLGLSLMLDRPHDFAEFHRGFGDFVRQLSLSTREFEELEGAARSAVERIRQLRRIALLGLSGRAVLLERAGRLRDAQPFLEVMRDEYQRLSDLVRDFVLVLDDPVGDRFSWSDWESEGRRPLETYSVDASKYPTIGFLIRALEFAADQELMLPMQGNAERARDLVNRLVQDAESAVQIEDRTLLETARERLDKALAEAGQADARAEQDAIIAASLDQDRVGTFVADFLAGRYGRAVLEPIFRAFGAYRFTRAEAVDGTGFGWNVALQKAIFTTTPGNVRFFGIEQHGVDFERSLVGQLVEAFDEVKPVECSLSHTEDVRAALDVARENLRTDALVAVMVGDWSDTVSDLRYRGIDWFEPNRGTERQLPSPFLLGTYGGIPVLLLQDARPRRIVVVDAERWGCIEKAVIDDGEFQISVNEIDEARADEILRRRAEEGRAEPDEAAARRDLLLSVEWKYLERVKFHVTDTSRAIVFVDSPSQDGQGLTHDGDTSV